MFGIKCLLALEGHRFFDSVHRNVLCLCFHCSSYAHRLTVKERLHLVLFLYYLMCKMRKINVYNVP